MSLMKEIASDVNNKIIIFVETNKKVEDRLNNIERDGYGATSIHGDKTGGNRFGPDRASLEELVVDIEVGIAGTRIEEQQQ